MGDRLQTGEPSRYVTSHPGQLSLAIPPWVGAMSTSESWGVNRHTARYTSPVSVISQCKLVSGWGLRKRRSAPPYGPLWLGKDFTFSFFSLPSLLHYSSAITEICQEKTVMQLFGQCQWQLTNTTGSNSGVLLWQIYSADVEYKCYTEKTFICTRSSQHWCYKWWRIFHNLNKA